MASKDLSNITSVQGYRPVGNEEPVSKLAFTAVAAPDPAAPSPSTAPHDIRDLDQHIAIGPPATKKEVYAYYAYYAGNNGIGSFQ